MCFSSLSFVGEDGSLAVVETQIFGPPPPKPQLGGMTSPRDAARALSRGSSRLCQSLSGLVLVPLWGMGGWLSHQTPYFRTWTLSIPAACEQARVLVELR